MRQGILAFLAVLLTTGCLHICRAAESAPPQKLFTEPLTPSNPYPLLLTTERPQQYPPPPARENMIRALIFTGGHHFDRKEFFAVFNDQPDITWREVSHPDAYKWLSPEKDAEYDVLVWYDRPMKISAADQKLVLDALNRGRPILALHHMLDTWHNWPEGIKIIGGRYHRDPWNGHPASEFKPNVSLRMQIADAGHPITRGMRDFDIVDECYLHTEVLPGVHPLLTVDHPASDGIIAWTHTYGKSPIVYIRPGHGPSTFRDPNYRRLVLQSIRHLANRLPDPSNEGFVDLFNGKNLDNWHIVGKPEAYVVHDGLLTSLSGLGGDWLRSRRIYGDFILRAEWRLSENGNSGVFVRAKEESEGYPWHTGSEVQMTNRDSVQDNIHWTGALYGVVPVDPRPEIRSFEWHNFEIQCRGPCYKVFVDNVPVIDVDARRVPALHARPLVGYIGLQDAHSYGWMQVRKMSIKELTPMYPRDWRLGIQLWTFHKFTFTEAVEKAKSLGLKYIEAFAGQSLSPAQPKLKIDPENPSIEVMDQIKRLLLEADLQMATIYVGTFTADEAKNRRIFEYAKAMGIETIVSEPEFESFPSLDRLTQEFGINVAVHNHAQPSRYWDPQIVMEHVGKCNPRIGACPDVGHWGRTGLDTVEGLKLLAGRILCVHMKDVEGANTAAKEAEDVIWGQGASNIRGVLAELHRQNFAGPITIEYEKNWDNNIPDVTECIGFYEKVRKELGHSN